MDYNDTLCQDIEDRIWVMESTGVTALYIANHFNIPLYKATTILDTLCIRIDEIVNIGVEYFWRGTAL